MRCAARLAAGIALITTALVSCQADSSTPPPTPAPQPIGVTPLYLDWVSASLAAYQDEHAGTLFSLDIYAPAAGLEAVQDGEIELLIGAIEADASLFATPLMRDAIAVIHNPELGVRRLSVEDLRLIFAGGAQNWQEFGGEDLSIHPVIPIPGDDLRLLFRERVMGTFQFSTLAQLQASPGQIIALVEDEPGAIGFVPFSQLESATSVFRIDGQALSQRSIENGSYPLSYWVTATGEAEPEGALRDWLGWVQAQDH